MEAFVFCSAAPYLVVFEQFYIPHSAQTQSWRENANRVGLDYFESVKSLQTFTLANVKFNIWTGIFSSLFTQPWNWITIYSFVLHQESISYDCPRLHIPLKLFVQTFFLPLFFVILPRICPESNKLSKTIVYKQMFCWINTIVPTSPISHFNPIIFPFGK